ncbi:hypothetical protein [Nocardioides bruguierae]|uniref:Uncharacterized protein n=1 Tax=Nocardioides bruguierae TaxID=2945102 RepID=A0A9X2IG45_9ACTN|nr:hypothetical protein [Nocardioides bruguierae]MCM0622506.1 hypothetical protein [Nocardioides bruguierae]
MTSGKKPVLRHTLVVRHPDTMDATALLADEPIPDWATSLVHPGNLTGTQKATDYSKWSKADLEAEVSRRNGEDDREGADLIQVPGPGNKPDLIAALVADDDAATSE